MECVDPKMTPDTLVNTTYTHNADQTPQPSGVPVKAKKKMRNKLMEEINTGIEPVITPFKFGSKNQQVNPLGLSIDHINQFCVVKSTPKFMKT